MTDYDYSPGAYAAFQRKQQMCAGWAQETAQCAPQYRSPFVPSSHASSPSSPAPRSSTPMRSPRSPQSQSQPHSRAGSRAPRRSHTLGTPLDVVTPRDSVSQVSAPRSRARSHSPSRRHHSSHRSSSGSHGHRSNHRSGATTYIVSPTPTYTSPQYTTGPYTTTPQPMQYPAGQPQPAAYVVVPRDRRVQIIYPQPVPHTSYPQHQESNGGLLHRIFGSQSGKSHSRSRSVGLRSGSR
ncbi:hypothetical protein DFH06DRAFT_64490 [Mycena polygramma]|nr:hypothetical protein DFH06DRAFT_173847 [Mycena polygramma]KAJ7620770.1 hypothetical protein DFH06DRAFT_64490 [Mycena polygramma]